MENAIKKEVGVMRMKIVAQVLVTELGV